MSDNIQINKTSIKLFRGDITDYDIESFVYYAQPNLQIGSGFGTAIAMRGGLSIQNELKEHGVASVTDVVITDAGKMKAKKILHAVGPAFQEPDIESKLQKTIINTLKAADENGIQAIAFPPMGAGFFGVPLEVSADITLNTISDYLKGETKIKEVVVGLLENKDYQHFKQKLASLK